MDLVEEIIADWASQRPDINCAGKAVVCRVLRSYSNVLAELEKAFKPLGITPNVFSALVTIRRRGRTAEVTVKTIMQEALVTSGATSNLINRLIKSGLVTKRKGGKKEDARTVFIKLTPKGLKLIDKAMEVQAACERKLTNGLTQAEKQQLSTLLKKLQPEENHYVK